MNLLYTIMKSQYHKSCLNDTGGDFKEYLQNYEGLRQISEDKLEEIKKVSKIPKKQDHTLLIEESEDVEGSMAFFLRQCFIPSSED
ncbi:MAG TPA: hypothetical protein VEV16_06065 [Daejeonella sp.]|nr:hypothetical protein [Daejeonella sp.]